MKEIQSIPLKFLRQNSQSKFELKYNNPMKAPKQGSNQQRQISHQKSMSQLGLNENKKMTNNLMINKCYSGFLEQLNDMKQNKNPNKVQSRCSLNIAVNNKNSESWRSTDNAHKEITTRTENNIVKLSNCYDSYETGNLININLKSCNSNYQLEEDVQTRLEYDPYCNVNPSNCNSIQSQSFRKPKKSFQRNNSNLFPANSRRIKSLSRDFSNVNNRYPKVHCSFTSTEDMSSNSNSKMVRKLANQLFKARCIDLGISSINDKMKENFMATIINIFNRKWLSFKDLGLGSESLKVVSKILNTYCYKVNSEHENKARLLRPTHLNLANMTKLGFSKSISQVEEKEQIEDIGVRMILNSIIKHKSLVYVNLQNNNMDDGILCILFKGLQHNNTIIHIDIGNGFVLGRNKIRMRAAEGLRGLLLNNSVLQILNIENCGVNQETFPIIIKGVCSSNIISLNLTSNEINNTCIQFLVEKFLNLKYQLIELKLGNVKINDKCCSYLTTFLHESKIQKLDLSCNELTFKAGRRIFEVLERNQSLTNLDLHGNEFSEDDNNVLKHFLTFNVKLKVLNMSNCSLLSAHLKSIGHGLKSNSSLKSLILSNNHIKDDGFELFVTKMKGNKTLEYVDFSENMIKQNDCTSLK